MQSAIKSFCIALNPPHQNFPANPTRKLDPYTPHLNPKSISSPSNPPAYSGFGDITFTSLSIISTSAVLPGSCSILHIVARRGNRPPCPPSCSSVITHGLPAMLLILENLLPRAPNRRCVKNQGIRVAFEPPLPCVCALRSCG